MEPRAPRSPTRYRHALLAEKVAPPPDAGPHENQPSLGPALCYACPLRNMNMDYSDDTRSEWEELKRLVSQKNGKRIRDDELRWDEDLTGNRVLVLNVVAASFYDKTRLIRFFAQPQLQIR